MVWSRLFIDLIRIKKLNPIKYVTPELFLSRQE